MKNKTNYVARAHKRTAIFFGLLNKNLGRGLICVLIFLGLIFRLSGFVSAGQPIELWNKTAGGGDYDYTENTVVDSNNNIVVTGWTSSFGAGIRDFWTIKYAPDGTMLWNKTAGGSNGDYASDVEVDSNSNIIVTGETYSFGTIGGDFWTIKYGVELENKTKITKVKVNNTIPFIEAKWELWDADNITPGIQIKGDLGVNTTVIKCAIVCDNNSVADIEEVEAEVRYPNNTKKDNEYLMLSPMGSFCWKTISAMDYDHFMWKYTQGLCDIYEGNLTMYGTDDPEGMYKVTVEVKDKYEDYGVMINYFNYSYKYHIPFIEWMWLLLDEDDFTNGTQVYPEPGGSKTVTKCVIACDQNGIGDIVVVDADLYYPNKTLKEHEHLTPALNSSMCRQTIPTEDEEEFWDKYNRDICDIHSDTFTMEFWEEPGDYLVDVEIHDSLGDHAHMNNTFEYMLCIAIDNDAYNINFISVVSGSSSNVTGDNDMVTLNAPTLRNICNVPANISVTGTNLSCTTLATCNAATIPMPIIGFDVGVYNCPIPGAYGAPTLPVEPGPMSTNLENFQLNVPLGTLQGSYQGNVVIAGIPG